jgi:hypothetical protein
MQVMQTGKQVLPFPYDQDFTGIVTRVRGKRAATRTALVNSLKVAAYLRAGATLVENNLGAQAPSGDPANEDRKPYWSGIRFLTERAVIHEMEHNPPPFLSLKGAGPLRSTWASHDDYINDLLAFLFHGMNYEPQYGEELQSQEKWLVERESFVEALDVTSFHEVETLCRMPLFRLQLLMAATAERNDGIHNAIAENYSGALEPWKKIYESTFAARGFRLRPGITLDQLAGMLAGISEGLAVRQLGDPGAGILRNGPAGNLLGMAVIGILHSYLELTTEPSGRSLRVDFEERARRARRDGGS